MGLGLGLGLGLELGLGLGIGIGLGLGLGYKRPTVPPTASLRSAATRWAREMAATRLGCATST